MQNNNDGNNVNNVNVIETRVYCSFVEPQRDTKTTEGRWYYIFFWVNISHIRLLFIFLAFFRCPIIKKEKN